jgi:hypothetical protein
MVGVVMRLPEGVTLKMLQNVYNSRKRQEKIYSNARRNKVPYNANAAAAEQAFPPWHTGGFGTKCTDVCQLLP